MALLEACTHGCSAGHFIGCQSAATALCSCCSAGVAMHAVAAFLDARTQGCTVGILPAIYGRYCPAELDLYVGMLVGPAELVSYVGM